MASDLESRKARFRHMGDDAAKPAVLPLRAVAVPDEQPDNLSVVDALKVVRLLARETKNIVIVPHGKKRQRQRRITRPQIERCVQKGEVSEGPFVNMHGNWQINLTRYAAGEEITCAVAIEWVRRLVVITAF